MESKLISELHSQAIEVYLETDFTPKKLLSVYEIAVRTLELSTEAIKLLISEEQNLQEKLSQQSEQIQKLVNQSELL